MNNRDGDITERLVYGVLGRGRLLYVGSTRCLRARIGSHCSEAAGRLIPAMKMSSFHRWLSAQICRRRHESVRFVVLCSYICDEKTIVHREAELIRDLLPALNRRQYVPARPTRDRCHRVTPEDARQFRRAVLRAHGFDVRYKAGNPDRDRSGTWQAISAFRAWPKKRAKKVEGE